MTGKTHVAIGIAAGLTISHGHPLDFQLPLILASLVGSLAPDLDHPKAKLNQRLLLFNNNFYKMFFYILLAGFFFFLYFTREIDFFLYLGLISCMVGISSHRGFTHSIIGALAAIYIVGLITLSRGYHSIYYGFATGYILHLVADFFTPQGIRLFYPMKNNVSSPITIKSDKHSEDILLILLAIYSISLLIIA